MSNLQSSKKILNRTKDTDEEISKLIGVSVSDVKKIKDGSEYPKMRTNKLIHKIYCNEELEYNSSLIGSFFKDGIHVGNKVSRTRMIFSIIFLIFVCALFTGFGYQPFWLFLLILILGIFFVLPGCFYPYWIIHNDSVDTITFSKYGFIKMLQLLNLMKKTTRRTNFNEVDTAEIIYKTKKRNSPLDFTPDYFNVELKLKNNKVIKIEIDHMLTENLQKFVELLISNDIDVYDKQNVISVLESGENIFNHFNKQYA